MENSNEVYNKLQLQLILNSAESQKISPDNDFCVLWIDMNSEKLRNYWNNLKCKNCPDNFKCKKLVDLLQKALNTHETRTEKN